MSNQTPLTLPHMHVPQSTSSPTLPPLSPPFYPMSSVMIDARRHDRYYIPSGDVVFMVEDVLFRVHRYFFVRESPVFRDMLSMPCPKGSDPEGLSDHRPIHLPQVKQVDFGRFCWVFYDPKYSHTASVEEWSSILALAHLWQFEEVKAFAVRALDKMWVPPVQKAILARDYDVGKDWLETAYTIVGVREQPLTAEEGRRLGMDVVVKIAELRERIRERRYQELARQPQRTSCDRCFSPTGMRSRANSFDSEQARKIIAFSGETDPILATLDDVDDVRELFDLPRPEPPLDALPLTEDFVHFP